MKEEDLLWADALLQDVRAAADPTRSDRARNLSSLEQRLSLGEPGGGAAGSHTAALTAAAGSGVTLRVLPSMPGASPLGALPAASGATPAPPSLGLLGPRLQLAVKAACLFAFGFTTGAIGYLWGHADAREAVASSVFAPPAQPRQEDVARPALATPAAPSPVAEASAPSQPRAHAATSPRPKLAAPTVTATPAVEALSTPEATPAAEAPSAPEATPTAGALSMREAIELLRRAEASVRRDEGLDALSCSPISTARCRTASCWKSAWSLAPWRRVQSAIERKRAKRSTSSSSRTRGRSTARGSKAAAPRRKMNRACPNQRSPHTDRHGQQHVLPVRYPQALRSPLDSSHHRLGVGQPRYGELRGGCSAHPRPR